MPRRLLAPVVALTLGACELVDPFGATTSGCLEGLYATDCSAAPQAPEVVGAMADGRPIAAATVSISARESSPFHFVVSAGGLLPEAEQLFLVGALAQRTVGEGPLELELPLAGQFDPPVEQLVETTCALQIECSAPPLRSERATVTVTLHGRWGAHVRVEADDPRLSGEFEARLAVTCSSFSDPVAAVEAPERAQLEYDDHWRTPFCQQVRRELDTAAGR